ncbi:uncharacterized protein [Dermacentor albipictus]|uniref:uncharacterized protein isoform X7 n=1 Tax=Dermacentor albipictus TaxID=60249 RepID=UPI0038FC584A
MHRYRYAQHGKGLSPDLSSMPQGQLMDIPAPSEDTTGPVCLLELPTLEGGTCSKHAVQVARCVAAAFGDAFPWFPEGMFCRLSWPHQVTSNC